MGYHTSLCGEFTIEPPLTDAQFDYLKAFNYQRRMKRDAAQLPPDPVREAVGLPPGQDGGYFVGAPDNNGQNTTPDVLDFNNPPEGQPGVWCPWEPGSHTTLVWDDVEKPYDYVEWLEYLIEHFFTPWGLKLSGTVEWNGEDPGDLGTITITDNVVTTTNTIAQGQMWEREGSQFAKLIAGLDEAGAFAPALMEKLARTMSLDKTQVRALIDKAKGMAE